MKKFLILNAAFLILNFSSHAQVFIFGGKGIVNGCRLQNKSVTDAGDAMKYDFTWGFAGGAYVRYYFNEATYYSNTNISLCIEALFNNYGQNYSGNIFNSAGDSLIYSLNSKVRISSFDVPVLVHFRGQAGLYGEVGVSFGMINGVKTDYSRDPEDVNSPNYSGRAADELYTSSNLSGIFGFGIDSELSEKVNFTAGLRLTYGITDLTAPQKEVLGDAYNQTHSATIGIVIGLGYILNFYHDYH
jgi:hypothetical protein